MVLYGLDRTDFRDSGTPQTPEIKEGLNASYTGGVRALCKESVKTWHGQNRENPVNRLAKCARFFEAVTWERNNRVMTFNAAREWQFSSEQGKANYEAAQKQYPAQAIVDMAALRNNMRHLVSVVGGPNSGTAVMGVVKADAYGHGLIPAALAALAGGATWLGTAQSHEALLLRKAGIGPDRCHILTWVYNGMAVPFDELIDNDIDISVGSLPGIDGVAAAARRLGKTARVHVKVDSGFGRNGFTPATFDAALAKLVPLAKEGVLHIVGQWSHLAVADAPDVPEFRQTDREFQGFHPSYGAGGHCAGDSSSRQYRCHAFTFRDSF